MVANTSLLKQIHYGVTAASNPHCNENPIYVFPEKEFFGAASVPISHIYVSLSNLYIPRIGPYILL
jgi:hypothetical protein